VSAICHRCEKKIGREGTIGVCRECAELPPVRSEPLLACPFCGKPVGYITSLCGYRVVCDACDIYGPRGRDNAEARQRWNQRAHGGEH
jgi:hypothetical protein